MPVGGLLGTASRVLLLRLRAVPDDDGGVLKGGSFLGGDLDTLDVAFDVVAL